MLKNVSIEGVNLFESGGNVDYIIKNKGIYKLNYETLTFDFRIALPPLNSYQEFRCNQNKILVYGRNSTTENGTTYDNHSAIMVYDDPVHGAKIVDEES